MQIVLNNAQNVIQVDKEMFNEVIEYLKSLSIKKKSKFEYFDENGDLVVVENGQEFVIPTNEDLKAIFSVDEGDFIDEDDVKKRLNV